MQWQDVCNVNDLQENSGVCALVDNQQVALFYLPTTEQVVFATANYDPIGKANVLSRGIVGDVKGQVVVASPLYKQHFSLETGICLENEAMIIPVYACRIDNDKVQVDIRSVAPLRQLIKQVTE